MVIETTKEKVVKTIETGYQCEKCGKTYFDENEAINCEIGEPIRYSYRKYTSKGYETIIPTWKIGQIVAVRDFDKEYGVDDVSYGIVIENVVKHHVLYPAVYMFDLRYICTPNDRNQMTFLDCERDRFIDKYIIDLEGTLSELQEKTAFMLSLKRDDPINGLDNRNAICMQCGWEGKVFRLKDDTCPVDWRHSEILIEGVKPEGIEEWDDSDHYKEGKKLMDRVKWCNGCKHIEHTVFPKQNNSRAWNWWGCSHQSLTTKRHFSDDFHTCPDDKNKKMIEFKEYFDSVHGEKVKSSCNRQLI